MAGALQLLAARAAARNQNPSESGIQIDPNTEPTDLMKQVGGYGLGAVAAAGNFLDTPGSVVRDLVVGKGWDSFDQILSPFSDADRTTGREVLTKFGFTKKNKEGGVGDWYNDPGEAGADIAGFMAEIALDPFGPIGKVVGAGKLLDKVGRTAGRLSGTTLRALPLGGKIVDAVGPKVNWTARQLMALFDAPVQNTTTKRSQDLMRGYSAEVFRTENSAHAYGAMVIKQMEDKKFILDPSNEASGKNLDALYRYVNGAEDAQFIIDQNPVKLPDEFKPMIDGLIKQANDIHATLGNYYHTSDLLDEAGIQYFPQYMADLFKFEALEDGMHLQTKSTRQFAESEATALHMRDFLFKGMRGGVANWDSVLRDPEWNEIIAKVRQDPMLVRREDTLQAAYEGIIGPRHLEKFADDVDMTTKELWSELGFDRTKPYALIDDVETKLNDFLVKQQDLAKQHKGVFKQQTAWGNAMYDDVMGGTGTSVRMVNGVPTLPNGQVIDTLDGISDDHIYGWMKANAPDADAVARIEYAKTNGIRPVSWDVDGQQKFFIPRMKAKNDSQWERRIGGLRKAMEKDPLQNKEINRDIFRERIEEKYGNYLMKDMPALDAEGRMTYDINPTYQSPGVVLDANGKATIDPQRRGRIIDVNGNDVPDPLKRSGVTAGADGKIIKDPLQPGRQFKYTRKAALAFEEKYKDEIAQGFLSQQKADRYDAVADLINNHQRIRRIRLFSQNPIIAHIDYMASNARLNAIGEVTAKWMADSFVENAGDNLDRYAVQKRSMTALHSGEVGDGLSIEDFFKSHKHFDQELMTGWAASNLKRRPEMAFLFEGDNLPNQNYTKAFKEAFLATRPDPEVFQDLNNVFKSFESLPEVSHLMKIADSALTIQKAGLLSTVSGVVRDVTSAFLQSWTMGDFNFLNPKSYVRLHDAAALVKGKLPSEIPLTPAIAGMLKQLNLPDTGVNRSNAFLSLFTGSIHRARLHQLGGDSLALEASGTSASLMKGMPGYQHRNIFQSIHNRFKEQSIGQLINPINVQGVMTREVPNFAARDAGVAGAAARTGNWVPRSTENLLAGVSGDARTYASNVVYLSSILNRMDEGMDFHEAFKLVDLHQVSYDPRNYTRFEKTYMKRIFPFYSFISRSFKQTALELYTNPGGKLGSMIRAQRLAQGNEDSYVPYDLQDSASIPIAGGPNGELKYITSLGMMHEDALTYLAPTQGVRGILQKVIGSSNPLVKGIIEEGTNTSTFFDGPMGGRRLDDLDPAIGRILTNFGITSLPASNRPKPFIHPIVEAMAANSPAAAMIRIAKIASEKPERRSTFEKVLNLGTGLRTKVVTQEALVRELRDRLNAEEIALGARPITIVTGVSKLTQQMREAGNTQEADKLEAIQQALGILKKRMEERAKKLEK